MKILYSIIFALLSMPIFATQNDAQYILLKKEYTFHADGSYEMTCEHKIKYLTYTSFHRYYGETFIVYNPLIQSLKINRSQTTMTDGKLVIAPDNSFNEVLPAWAARSGAYNHYREMVVTHTGLEVGAISDLSYTILTQKTPFEQIQIFEPLRFDSPVDMLEIIFHVPEGLEFKVREINGANNYEITEQDHGKTYRYSFSNLPAKELYRVTNPFFIPYIEASVGTKKLNDLLREIEPANEKAGNISMNDLDKVLDIQKEMLNIRTINVPMEYQLFPLQTPEIIRQQNSGTLYEKTILFQQLLKENHIEAEIIYEIPKPLFDENMGNILPITNMYILVNVEGKPTAFSAVKKLNTNPIEKRSAVFVKKSDTALEKIETMGTQHIKLISDIQVAFDKKTKNMTVKRHEKIDQTGDGLAYIHNADHQPSRTDITNNQDAKITKYIRENTNKLSFEIESETEVSDDNNLLKITLYPVKNGIDALGFVSLPESINTPISIPLLITEEDMYTITLPAKAKPFIKQKEVNMTGAFGDLNLKIDINKNVVTVKRQMIFRASNILPDDYAEFVKMMRNWQAESFRSFYVQF